MINELVFDLRARLIAKKHTEGLSEAETKCLEGCNALADELCPAVDDSDWHQVQGIIEGLDNLRQLRENMRPLPPEFQKVIDENYWDLVGE